MGSSDRVRSRIGVVTLVLSIVVVLGACSSSGSSSGEKGGSGGNGGSSGGQVLPVESDPIVNDSIAEGLVIDSVLVENNEDASGKAVDDHLEIALSNTSADELTGFEIFYTFTDRKTNDSESYYFKLPDSFTIPANGSRVAHFDDTGAPDHFPVNAFSLYATSRNAQDVTVEVSAAGVTPQTAVVKKDKGGPEEND